MWEILVPTISNTGKPIHTRYHRVWDAKVRAISSGLTVLKPVTGQWVNPDDVLFKERMIPVRIMCTRDDINSIIDLTIKYYCQDAVLAYRISDACILKYNSGERI